MKRIHRLLIGFFLLSTTAILLGCGEEESIAQQSPVASNGIVLDVYKSESCGCCGVWTEYMKAYGYNIRIHHPDDLNAVKDQYGIAAQWQSCHTAVTENGYFFEGHIPAKLVSQFLKNPPTNAAGLAVPGMPLGSPGMEVGDRFTPYDIVQLNKDGSTTPYATISEAAQQY